MAAALRPLLADRRWRADLLVGDRVSGAEGWSDQTGATVLLAEPSPTLAIAGQSWDEFLASKSKNFRDQVRRRERKLAKSHELSFRLSDGERLADDMGTLLGSTPRAGKTPPRPSSPSSRPSTGSSRPSRLSAAG